MRRIFGMLLEEDPFQFEGPLDSKAFIDVFLRSAPDSEVAKTQRVDLALKEIKSICSFVHEIDLGYNTYGSLSCRVYFSGHLESVRISEICVRSGESQDHSVLRLDVSVDDALDLLLDISWLSHHRNLGDARKVDHRELHDLGGINSERNSFFRHSFRVSGHFICLSDNFTPDLHEISELFACSM
jgi:hypothetical protein